MLFMKNSFLLITTITKYIVSVSRMMFSEKNDFIEVY